MPEITTSAPPAPPARKPAGRGAKKKMKTLLALGVTAVLLTAGGLALNRFLNGGEEEMGEIYSQPAMIGTIQSKVSGSGTAKAKESSAITLTQGGIVEEVYVTSGQTVMEGDPLYTIVSPAAQEEVSNAQSCLDDLMQEMADLRSEVADLTVRAPFAGKLRQVQKFTPDQEVPKGSVIAELVNDRKLKLSLYFSYAYEQDIHVGQSVDVSVPAVMNTFRGEVEEIHMVSYISPEGAVHFEVVIAFENPGTLTAGMDAAAVLKAADGADIYPYENGKIEFYETRNVLAKAGGPVIDVGNLRNYANVEAGEPLLYLGSSVLDADIRAKQDEIEAAQVKLDEALRALENFNAAAPISGTIISCTLAPGAEVKGGDTVIIISNTTTMLVTINVDDQNISFIKPGNMVELNWNGMMYMGQVTAIDMGGAQAGQGMTNYPVTLSVDNFDGSLMDGAWLQYSFVTSESEDCVLVPTTAVKYFSDAEGNRQSVVFVRRDVRPDDVPELELPTFDPNSGQKRTFPTEEEGFYPVLVETGLGDPQNVEILSGIEVDDEVFVNYVVTDSDW